MAGHGAVDTVDSSNEEIEYDPWFKWGVTILYGEMIIAVFVTIYSLYLAFNGTGGIGGH